jgi:hypothetical protein
MRWSARFLLVTTIAAAAIVAASFTAGTPAVASERIEAGATAAAHQVAEMSARKRHMKTHRMKTHHKKVRRATGLRVHRLSRRAAEPPNPDRPYYRPVPSFYPFGQDRGYF